MMIMFRSRLTDLQVDGVYIFLHGPEELGVVTSLEMISRHTDV